MFTCVFRACFKLASMFLRIWERTKKKKKKKKKKPSFL
jgi:hypothetical protein